MKTKNLFLLPALIAALNLLLAGQVTAQPWINSDGANPYAGLITNSSSGTLYGTARNAGSSGAGTVFAVGTNGTGFTILHSFTGSDGAAPSAALVLSGNTLYGTAGTVFKVNTDGTGFATLSGPGSYAGLVLSGSTLYGTTEGGGGAGSGAIFAINTDGTGFTNLYSFTATSTNSTGNYTNSDGAYPHAGLILSGSTLYGTARGGGNSGNGTVFAINTDGTGFTSLHTFAATHPYDCGYTIYGTPVTIYGNSDGANPIGGLILSGNTVYGTASAGGGSGSGAIFAINTDGTGFTNLHIFQLCAFNATDGGSPQAGLILSGSTLYGTTYYGGIWHNGPVFAGNTWGNGTVFAVNTDGTGFRPLHGFAQLMAPPLPAPQLTISLAGTNVLLMWPSAFQWGPYGDFSTYRLQSATSLGPSAVWTDVGPGPVVVNGQKIVASPVAGAQQFYRLILRTGSRPFVCDANSDCPCGVCIQGNLEAYCAYADGSPCDY